MLHKTSDSIFFGCLSAWPQAAAVHHPGSMHCQAPCRRSHTRPCIGATAHKLGSGLMEQKSNQSNKNSQDEKIWEGGLGSSCCSRYCQHTSMHSHE